MKLINQLKVTWSFKNYQLIIALALAVVIIIQNVNWPPVTLFSGNDVTYIRATTTPPTLADVLEQRAREIYKEREPVNMENARIEAITEQRDALLKELYISPFVDYDTINDTINSLENDPSSN